MDTSEQFPQPSAAPAPQKQKGNKKGSVVAIIILSVLLAGAVGTLAWLYTTNKITFAVATQEAKDGKSVCQSFIGQYNESFKKTSLEEYTQSLKQASDKAKAADSNNADPTCVYMQFSYASFTKDIDETKRLAAILTTLANQGAYLTGQLANPQGIEAIQSTAKQLEAADAPLPSNETVQGNG